LSLLLSLKYSRKLRSRKLSALDWERRTEPRRHSARFQDASRRSGGGLGDRSVDRDTLVQLLKERQDISSEEADQIIAQLESTRDCIDNGSRTTRWQSKAQELRGRCLSA